MNLLTDTHGMSSFLIWVQSLCYEDIGSQNPHPVMSDKVFFSQGWILFSFHPRLNGYQNSKFF